jgi:hypothetical protein
MRRIIEVPRERTKIFFSVSSAEFFRTAKS